MITLSKVVNSSNGNNSSNSSSNSSDSSTSSNCAKPSAQLPKHMHILHRCYKLADNPSDIVPVAY